ncbi:MAG: hypothetical protein JO053_05325 [Acidobacteria bacterium]|nr:hypothetical protein [Acidobacteriota bacterium]
MKIQTLAIAKVFSTRQPRLNARVAVLIAAFLFVACGRSQNNAVNPRLADEMPKKIIWAWERPENLSFLDPNQYGVAFLSQTIFLQGDQVNIKPRRQPLELAPGIYVIAVTRIETNKDTDKRPTFSDEMSTKVANAIAKTRELPNVRAIQIDYDAVGSERAFYRQLVKEVRAALDAGADKSVRVPLTMTALASWCTGDAWFNDFPVDEAVPMVFQMGADEDKIKTYLRNGNDWREPLCRGSYGLSVDDPVREGIKDGRRIYYFKSAAWQSEDLQRLK